MVTLANNLELHHMDVNTTFLYRNLDEDVYMCLPPRYSVSTAGLVCQLHKSLYGLRQASCNWFTKFAATLQAYCFL